jgi:Metallopeptidase family M24
MSENKPISIQENTLDEAIEVTEWMQKQCIHAYLAITSELKNGYSEKRIEQAIRDVLRENGLDDFWYDIPVMVLIGVERFFHMANSEYHVKIPSDDINLIPGDYIFIDMHPRHPSGRWGNFAATGIYRPGDDAEAINFLQQMQKIQTDVVGSLNSQDNGADIANRFQRKFQLEQINLVDVQGCFGHDMLYGQKRGSFERDRRSFLDKYNTITIGGRIWGIEPGGSRIRSSGNSFVVARFEDCVYVPFHGPPIILGRQESIPVVF